MNFNFTKEIILSNESVLLRPIVLSDMDNLLSIAIADKTLLQFSPKPIHTKELLDLYINSALIERKNETRYSFSIFSLNDNSYAGSTAFLNVSNYNESIEIGATWIGKKFQSTGINMQCKFLMLQHAFEVLNAHRVEFRTDERNAQSRRALEKIGAKQEGILRESMLMYDGFKRSSVYYSILSHEWEIIKKYFRNCGCL